MTTLLFHINSFLAGGIEKVLIELLHGLDPKKYRIKLSIAHHLSELEILKKQLPSHVEVHYILDTPLLTSTKKKKILKTISLPEKLLEELVLPFFKKQMHRKKLKDLAANADVIIDFDMTLAPYTGLLKNKKKVAYCHFSLGHYWDGKKNKLTKLVNRLKRYDKVVMLCDEMKEKAIELYPALDGHVVRIYNALDFQKIRALADERLDGYERLKPGGYLLSAGRLAESQKDFTMLIKGYAACVKHHNLSLPLVIIGEGYSRAALEQLAHDLGVKDKVIFAGFQPNPYKWMKRCRLFAFCSKYEGLPTVLIEALALGCPIIATATPTGVEEILMQGQCGTIVPMGDVSALTDAMHALLHSPPLQQDYREHSATILQQFELQNMVREFERLVIR
jgi:glycosyltransferase involved in cell wall biosynthesis